MGIGYFLPDQLKSYLKGMARKIVRRAGKSGGHKQQLEIYNDADFAELLEHWGHGNAWSEVQVLLGGRVGNVLDLACGTGRASDFLKHNKGLTYFGCDISELLINRALGRGIPKERLQVGDATKLDYIENKFEYLFTIGSLEHFTVEGLRATLLECNRVCSGLTFHHIPVSKSGLNEGWVNDQQSFWCNSEKWWMAEFKRAFGENVWTMSSKWTGRSLKGVWFVTSKASYLV
jgi:SAM-dependent methyltransferase